MTDWRLYGRQPWGSDVSPRQLPVKAPHVLKTTVELRETANFQFVGSPIGTGSPSEIGID